MSDTDNAAKAQEILTRRDAKGQPIYDQVRKDAAGQWLARRADDHRVMERPA